MTHTHAHTQCCSATHVDVIGMLRVCMCVKFLWNLKTSQRRCPSIVCVCVCVCVCAYVGVFLIWLPWSTFNPFFSFIWSLMRLLSQFKEKEFSFKYHCNFGACLSASLWSPPEKKKKKTVHVETFMALAHQMRLFFAAGHADRLLRLRHLRLSAVWLTVKWPL